MQQNMSTWHKNNLFIKGNLVELQLGRMSLLERFERSNLRTSKWCCSAINRDMHCKPYNTAKEGMYLPILMPTNSGEKQASP